jgi:4,5-dihydroxyphthalate decarboxylase
MHRMQLKTLLGDYPLTSALKTGAIASDSVTLEFADFQPTNTGFKPMVRESRFDVSEMAIVTYLIAKAHGKPMVLLPATVLGRFQHDYALYDRSRTPLTPADLAGKRVGIRSFTTTTGAWMRGILANDYRVDLDAIRWVTFEEPHVAEYVDTTERAPKGSKILEMLLAGVLDAVLGERSDDPRFATLFADPAAEAKAWHHRHGIVPVNHMVVVSQRLAEANPDAVREVFRMLKASKAKAAKPTGDAIDFCPFGLEPLRKPLEAIVRYAAQQRLIPRAYPVEELFDDTTRLLG